MADVKPKAAEGGKVTIREAIAKGLRGISRRRTRAASNDDAA
ncbi:MAG: hypothetical protein V8Q79_11335 [Christensenellales bacterium]